MHARSQPDPREFRNALSTFTTGVTIITARAPDGAPVGITCNSFNSVSLDPPMVLWSLARSARSLPVFESAEYWAVHILSAGQETLANRFAKPGENKFGGIETEAGIGNVPLLTGCTSRLQCKTSFKHAGGDHIIFVGEVVDLDRRDIPPLVFQAGKYAVATRKAEKISLSRAPGPNLPVSYDEDFLGYLLGRAHFQFFTRVREHMKDYLLSDIHCFILLRLSFKDERSIDELNRMLSLTGQEVTPDVIQPLCKHGFVRMSGKGMTATCRLTDKGHDVALHLIAASKAIESEILDQFGYWNAISLKNLLKQLILQTDVGVPHPWEDLPVKDV
jgi:3-hydroxy-9,10-secoandrosta-1,3,5(10)-triene-9,17-dione monooxygenase reductase component